ncbi:MAG TPA: hypothetical protein VE135_28620 [Pyrinomonadaceae bacterium]|nr:hypothetical protein [Pyrinomonadaceae bacterium]
MHLSQADENASTRRLHPRITSPAPELRGSVAAALDPTPPGASISRQRRRSLPFALLLLAVVLIAAMTIVSLALFRPAGHVATTGDNSKSLIYPNSQTTLDTASDSGRAIQLQTGDSGDQVVAWYTTNLKPTKTLQLTPTTTVLKNQSATVTIVAEDGKTTILIKQAFP